MMLVTFKLSTHTKFWSWILLISILFLSLGMYFAYMWISNYYFSDYTCNTSCYDLHQLPKASTISTHLNLGALYATRDLAAVFSRWEEFHFERCPYVVGAEQKLHFRQLKAVLTRLGLDWEPRVEHVDFGLLLGPGRVKLANRKGTVLILDELLDEVVGEARAVIEEKNPALADKDAVAEAVGIGALVFNDLKRERIKDVLFDRAEILFIKPKSKA